MLTFGLVCDPVKWYLFIVHDSYDQIYDDLAESRIEKIVEFLNGVFGYKRHT